LRYHSNSYRRPTSEDRVTLPEIRAEPPVPLLVCLLPVRNAEADLPGFLASAGSFCDAIVALDDGSTDRSKAMLEAHPLVEILLENPPRQGYAAWHDAENRNRLLAAALELNSEWLLSLDADERFDARDSASLRAFLETDALPGCAYGFRHVPMREDEHHFLPRYEWAYRLFSAAPGQRFRNQKLHFAPVPTDIPTSRYVKTTLRIQHLGELTPEHRLRRFAKYLEADPKGQYGVDYMSILRIPPGLQIRPWEPRPEGMPVLLAQAQHPPEGDAIALSVIVIAQNDEAAIAASVRAIVEQDFPDPFEVILVTSGSDRTATIVRKEFPTVTVIELPNPALPGEARNAGLRIARGTYVTFPGSHVTIAPGSLKNRLRAHRRGYAMVTGVTENGTQTPAGWASYFLDHADGLPGQGPAEINGPPAHCSYARLPLLEVGGFPEGVRTAEDTAVNRALVQRGYVALRDPRIRFVHHSPCRTWRRLVRHHFNRGRGWGRLLVERHAESGHLLNRDVLRTRLLRHVLERLARVANGVADATPELQADYNRVRAGVALGAIASWLGMWTEILAPAPGKWAILTGQPRQTILIVSNGGDIRVHLADIDHIAGRVTTLELPSGMAAQNLAINSLSFEGLASVKNRSPSSLLRSIQTCQDIEGLEYIVGGYHFMAALLLSIEHPQPNSSTWSLFRNPDLWQGMLRDLRSGRVSSSLSLWQMLRVANSIGSASRSATAPVERLDSGPSLGRGK
ncbi:MAG: glycosyltransferase, partial [Chloroflexota bacterium]|nr:glycosyltransferase [Chloroflexota bacterium]